MLCLNQHKPFKTFLHLSSLIKIHRIFSASPGRRSDNVGHVRSKSFQCQLSWSYPQQLNRFTPSIAAHTSWLSTPCQCVGKSKRIAVIHQPEVNPLWDSSLPTLIPVKLQWGRKTKLARKMPAVQKTVFCLVMGTECWLSKSHSHIVKHISSLHYMDLCWYTASRDLQSTVIGLWKQWTVGFRHQRCKLLSDEGRIGGEQSEQNVDQGLVGILALLNQWGWIQALNLQDISGHASMPPQHKRR